MQQKANEQALQRLQEVKTNDTLQSLLTKKEKIVRNHMSTIETEIAKCLAELRFEQCDSVTGEMVRMLSAIVVSSIERFIDLPEDKEMMLAVIKENIDSLYAYMRQQEAMAARSSEIHQKIAEAESDDGQL